MKIFTKTKEYFPDETSRKKYYFLGSCFLVKNYTKNGKQFRLFGIPVYEDTFLHHKKTIRLFGICVYRKNLLKIKLKNSNILLFFDHSFGGGANVYFDIEKDGLLKEGYLIRIQCVPFFHNFCAEVYYSTGHVEKYTFYEDDLIGFLSELHYKKIIVSELVGYDTVKFLNYIKGLRKNTEELIFLCHDYQALCPSYTLMNHEQVYCGACTDLEACEACFSRLTLAPKEPDNSILLSGARSIRSWRAAWGEFFHLVDRVVAFDESVRDLFCRYYPWIQGKVHIRYHHVPALRKVAIRRDNIVIAFIGNISSVSKGTQVIRYFDERTDQYPGVKFVLVGCCAEPLKNIRSTGSYAREDLPDLLESRGVNLVFIPSVWPETFSYTTAEAMMMGLPIACFNYGAPAHRVSGYEHGLILDGAHLERAVPDIVAFMKQHVFQRGTDSAAG